MTQEIIEEKGLIIKKYRKGMIKIALFYPSVYSVAMSSLIFHRLYYMLSSLDGVYLERFFMDSLSGRPKPLRGLEYKTPLKEFDYIMIPVHYELDYANIVKALLGSNIEIFSAKRIKPKIIVGGPVITANPEPIADLADVEIIGDLEADWNKIVDIIYNGKIEPFDGIYIPSIGKYEVKAAFSNFFDFSDKRILTKETLFTLGVEVMRGCPFNCVFCMESYISKPTRYKDFNLIMDEIKALNKKYNEKVSLIGLTINSHPNFKDILRESMRNKLSISIPSLRAELLDEESVKLIHELGQQTLTIAPESSERVRYALGKEISDDAILETAKLASKYNLNLKLYLMVSIPGEREDDLKSIINLINLIKKVGVKKIHLSINPLIIKPRTPLQWLPMEVEENMKQKINYIKKNSIYDDFTSYDPFYALIQGSIALSDRNSLKFLIDVAINGVNRISWRRALDSGLSLYALKKRDDPLPWSHIKGAVNDDVLRKMFNQFKEKIELKNNGS